MDYVLDGHLLPPPPVELLIKAIIMVSVIREVCKGAWGSHEEGAQSWRSGEARQASWRRAIPHSVTCKNKGPGHEQHHICLRTAGRSHSHLPL